ncbi:MAG: DUF2313 domain-containing protein [Lachnospiraceae bacterium]|nr:DUF2313 domain-containing protein [Lachnospiraceae bacterium]
MREVDLEHFPTSESAMRMLNSVSTEFYEKSYVGKWLYQVMGLEYDDALNLAEELPLQFFPETATWGLRYHEEKWQIPVREHLSDDDRRKLIYEKMHFKAPMTPYKMEQYIQKIMDDMEVYVSDVHDSGEYVFRPSHPNIFKVMCIPKDTLDVRGLKKMLDKIKQSHTVYIIAELIIIIINHQNIGNINVSDICIHISIPFVLMSSGLKRNGWFLDGEYLLDGRKLLDSGMLSKIRDTGIIIKGISMLHHEKSVDMCVISKRNEWYLDGEHLLDGSKLLNSEVVKEGI